MDRKRKKPLECDGFRTKGFAVSTKLMAPSHHPVRCMATDCEPLCHDELSASLQLLLLTQLQLGWNKLVSKMSLQSDRVWFQACLRAMDRIIGRQGYEACGFMDVDDWFHAFAKLSRNQQIDFRQVAAQSFLRQAPVTQDDVQEVLRRDVDCSHVALLDMRKRVAVLKQFWDDWNIHGSGLEWTQRKV